MLSKAIDWIRLSSFPSLPIFRLLLLEILILTECISTSKDLEGSVDVDDVRVLRFRLASVEDANRETRGIVVRCFMIIFLTQAYVRNGIDEPLYTTPE